MLLTLDIGNSNIFAGIFEKDDLISTFRIPLNKKMSSVEFEGFLSSELKNNISCDADLKAAFSSVVPSINPSVNKTLKEQFSLNPLLIEYPVNTNITFKIDNPSELGSDRMVNAVAAFDKYKKDVIIIDFGTATTFDCITGKGEFLGGLIAPGIGISASALISETSRLPEVSLQKPENFIGKNTIECIQSGLMNGYFAMTDGLVLKLKHHMKVSPLVVATGGFANIMSENCKYIDKVCEYLTLEGIKLVYELNS